MTRLPTCMLPVSADGSTQLHLAQLRQLLCLACGSGCLPRHRRRGLQAETGAFCMQVGLKRYAKVSTSAFAGLVGGKAIAVVRAAGGSGLYARPGPAMLTPAWLSSSRQAKDVPDPHSSAQRCGAWPAACLEQQAPPRSVGRASRHQMPTTGAIACGDSSLHFAYFLHTGAIVGGGGGPLSSVIIADKVIKQLRKLAKSKNIAAVVLRVDSGGGDALASDLMWREIRWCRVPDDCCQPAMLARRDSTGTGVLSCDKAAHGVLTAP